MDLPNDAETTDLIKRALKAVAAHAEKIQSPDRPPCKIDITVFNASRITKLYGTIARKGHDTEERPHRRSHLTHIRKGMSWENRQTISRERIEAVANMFQPKPETNGKHNSQSSPRINVPAYLCDHGIGFVEKQDGDTTKYLLDHSLFNADHKLPDSGIFQYA